MAPTGKTAFATSADNTAADSSHLDTQSADSAGDNIRLVMEQLQLLHTRMDEQAHTQSKMVRRDALRDHPVAIDTTAPSRVDAPYMLTGEFAPAPQREQTHSRSTSRKFKTDPDFVAMTEDLATDFDGDYFSRSFHMDAPLMPKTGEFKLSKRDCFRFYRLRRLPSSHNWPCRRLACH
jgi:hypothetical protein